MSGKSVKIEVQLLQIMTTVATVKPKTRRLWRLCMRHAALFATPFGDTDEIAAQPVA